MNSIHFRGIIEFLISVTPFLGKSFPKNPSQRFFISQKKKKGNLLTFLKFFLSSFPLSFLDLTGNVTNQSANSEACLSKRMDFLSSISSLVRGLLRPRVAARTRPRLVSSLIHSLGKGKEEKKKRVKEKKKKVKGER